MFTSRTASKINLISKFSPLLFFVTYWMAAEGKDIWIQNEKSEEFPDVPFTTGVQLQSWEKFFFGG